MKAIHCIALTLLGTLGGYALNREAMPHSMSLCNPLNNTHTKSEWCNLSHTHTLIDATAGESCELLSGNDNTDENITNNTPTKTKKKKKIIVKRKKKRPFNSPRTKSVWGVAAGYVSKLWLIEYPDGSKQEAGIYDETWLHGIQFGIRYNPLFKYGFGIDTGLYYEYYHNKSAQVLEENDDGDYYYYQTLNYHILRLPIHLEYRLNFSRNFQVFIFGGIANEYAIAGNVQFLIQGFIEPIYVEKDIYGLIIPSTGRYNLSASFGGGIRLGALQFNVNSQIGLIDTDKSSDYFLRQNNPLGFTLSIMF